MNLRYQEESRWKTMNSSPVQRWGSGLFHDGFTAVLWWLYYMLCCVKRYLRQSPVSWPVVVNERDSLEHSSDDINTRSHYLLRLEETGIHTF